MFPHIPGPLVSCRPLALVRPERERTRFRDPMAGGSGGAGGVVLFCMHWKRGI